jgi:hypothetical protein
MSMQLSIYVSYSQVAPNIVSYTAAFTALDKGDDRGYQQQLHVDEVDDGELQDVELNNSADELSTTNNSSNASSRIVSSDELSRGEVGLKLLATMQAEGHAPSLYCYSGLCTAFLFTAATVFLCNSLMALSYCVSESTCPTYCVCSVSAFTSL